MLPFDFPEDLSGVSPQALTAFSAQAVKAAEPLRAKPAHELSADERQTLRDLAGVVNAVKAEFAARAEDEATFAVLTPEPVAETPAEPETVIPSAADAAAFAATTGQTAVTPEPAASNNGLITYARQGAGEFTGMHQMAEELVKQLGSSNAPAKSYARTAFVELSKEFAAGATVASGLAADLEYGHLLAASAERRRQVEAEIGFTNGNQTAAAAYCSPSQVIYDLCELEGNGGIYPIPERATERGGLQFTTGPDFASIMNGAGYWSYTEAQVIANTPKPCMEIECPPFVDKRLRNLGLCVTGGILQRRGYPELIARFLRGAMVAHRHKVNAYVLSEMAAGSTLVDLSPIPAGSLVGDVTTSGVLAASEMVAVDLRYRNRMDPDAPLEWVGPVWGRAQLRADVSRRTGVDMISVTDGEIRRWFADRHLMQELVVDWQDASTGTVNGPGAAAPGITSFPGEIEFMIFPAGTWVKLADPTIRLETVYDSVKLATNQYTALFFEEGVAIAKVCPDSRRVVYPLCPTGATTAPEARACA
jgi:hypothetical protein